MLENILLNFKLNCMGIKSHNSTIFYKLRVQILMFKIFYLTVAEVKAINLQFNNYA